MTGWLLSTIKPSTMASIYTHTKAESGLYNILRESEVVATYDPATETLAYTKPEFSKKYAPSVENEVKEIMGEGDEKAKDEAPPATEPPATDEKGKDETPPVADPAPPAPAKETEEVKPAEATQLVRQLAAAAYDRYNSAVGGRAYNGDPLPPASEFFADATKVKQANGWLHAIDEVLGSLPSGTLSKSEKSLFQHSQAECARLRDEVARLRKGNRLDHVPERYEDAVDLEGAPPMDPSLGDLTPAFIEFARAKWPAAIFDKRYAGRLKSK